MKLGYISSKTGVAASTLQNADKACQAASTARTPRAASTAARSTSRSSTTSRRRQPRPRRRTWCRTVRVHGRQQLRRSRSSPSATSRTGRPAGRRRVRRHLLRREGQREHHLCARQRHPVPGLTYDGPTKLMKQMGAKKVAAVGYGARRRRPPSAKTSENFAVPSAGPRARVPDQQPSTSAAPTSGPLVLGIKNSGADVALPPARRRFEHRGGTGPRSRTA